MLQAKGKLSFRAIEEADFAVLLRWLTDMRVLEYYGGRDTVYTMETLKAHYTEPFPAGGFRLMIVFEGKAIGYGQVYRLSEEMLEEYCDREETETAFACDQFIGEPALWSRGLGTAYMQLLCNWVKTELGGAVLLVDPHQNNPRAVRAYEKAGFRIKKELPAHELFEGRREDCFLMERRLSEAADSPASPGGDQ